MAIPLSMVMHLEEFPRASIEYSGIQEVVQYRDQILPLVRVVDHIPMLKQSLAPEDPLQVIIYSEEGRSVGLVVGRIDDIVQGVITVKRHAPIHGILGSAVIKDKVTDLLDARAIIRAADPSFSFTTLTETPHAA